MADLAAVAVILLLSAVAFFVGRRIVVALIRFLISRTRDDIDKALERHRVFAPLVYLVPVWVVYRLLPLVLGDEAGLSGFFQGGLAVAMIIIGLVAIDRLLSALLDIYRSLASGRQITITSFVQAVKVVVYCIGLYFYPFDPLRQDPDLSA